MMSGVIEYDKMQISWTVSYSDGYT